MDICSIYFQGTGTSNLAVFTIDRFAILVNWDFRFEGLVRLLIETDEIYAFMFLNIKWSQLNKKETMQ